MAKGRIVLLLWRSFGADLNALGFPDDVLESSRDHAGLNNQISEVLGIKRQLLALSSHLWWCQVDVASVLVNGL